MTKISPQGPISGCSGVFSPITWSSSADENYSKEFSCMLNYKYVKCNIYNSMANCICWWTSGYKIKPSEHLLNEQKLCKDKIKVKWYAGAVSHDVCESFKATSYPTFTLIRWFGIYSSTIILGFRIIKKFRLLDLVWLQQPKTTFLFKKIFSVIPKLQFMSFTLALT